MPKLNVWLVKVDEYGVIPESFTIVVVVLLSTVLVVVSFWLLRKRLKLKNALSDKTYTNRFRPYSSLFLLDS